MNRVSNTRSSLFLMEIIISVLFLSLSGAICVQMFVKAHLIAQESVQTNLAVTWIQNLAESLYSCGGDMDELQEIFAQYSVRIDDDEAGAGALAMFLDADGQLIRHPAEDMSGVGADYELLVEISESTQAQYYGDMVQSRNNLDTLEQYGGIVRIATIALLDVEGEDIVVSDLTAAGMDEERVIRSVTVDCPVREKGE